MGQLTFDIQAHRGGAALAPENTLAAFGNALDIGVSTLECDVHISADGVAVLSHERTYAGRIIPLLTYAELATLHPPGPGADPHAGRPDRPRRPSVAPTRSG